MGEKEIGTVEKKRPRLQKKRHSRKEKIQLERRSNGRGNEKRTGGPIR
jgi:hypothetical protein